MTDGFSETPVTLVDELANQMATTFIEAMGNANETMGANVQVEHLIICLRISGQPAEQPDSTVAAFCLDEPRDMINVLLHALARAGEMVGLNVGVMPIRAQNSEDN